MLRTGIGPLRPPGRTRFANRIDRLLTSIGAPARHQPDLPQVRDEIVLLSTLALSKASWGRSQDHKALDVEDDASEERLSLLSRLQPCGELLAAATLDHRHDRQGVPTLPIGGPIVWIACLAQPVDHLLSVRRGGAP
ncbi:MAG TPA: hypothetical protein VNS22_19400 [Geminicoccus sp.]|uniref:hypothetical protein n=1 Tax=Geminicoccus sp. TaxID=2024832 RepID=UPI002BD4482D|nr:hypothetical protein [Geminicoccus sp.]HWL70526.1 hypothetical protein [Geminicoccus sp.]